MNDLVRIGVFLLIPFLGFVLTPGLAVGQFFVIENPLLGEKAPDFTLDSIRGEKINLHQYRDNSAAIIFFWATWCPHCREQLRELNTQGEGLKEKGFKLIIVDLGEEADRVQSYVEKQKINFDVLLDQDSKVAESYGLIGVPTYVIVDHTGLVRAVEHSLPDNVSEIVHQQE